VSQLPLPGNVRQLENLCHWITVLAPAQVVQVQDLPLELRQESASAAEAVPVAAEVATGAPTPLAPSASAAAPTGDWTVQLGAEVARRLASGEPELMDALTRQFEATVLTIALRHTHGRRVEAASRLGVGRNTITRKVQELGLED
jgi:two-component system nitrogen regulation response regulator GlnG